MDHSAAVSGARSAERGAPAPVIPATVRRCADPVWVDDVSLAEDLAFDLADHDDLACCRRVEKRASEPSCLSGELDFEARGRGTVVVSTACLHSLPRSYVTDVATEFDSAREVAIHLRQPLNARLTDFELATKALAALTSFNGNDPVLFQRDRKLVRLDGDHLVELTPIQLRHLLAQAARWYVGEGSERRAADPPPGVAQVILSLGDYPAIPEVDRVVTAPVLLANGSITTTPGYYPAARLYYVSAPELDGLEIPDEVSEDDVRRALQLLRDELLGDFLFASEADVANALGLFLAFFVREEIDGPTPLHVIDAPTKGSGKGLLADCIAIPAIGREAPSRRWSSMEEERRKTLLGILREGTSVVKWDNVTGRIDSPALNMALTEPIYSDRVMRTHDTPELPVRCIWLMTANNADVVGDMTRRIVPIRIDPKTDRPHRRTGPGPGSEWRHPLLRSWVRDHRADLVRAGLILIRNWEQQGKPLARTRRMGSYESYEATLGGILETVGVRGFLDNLGRVDAEDEVSQLGTILGTWAERYGDEPKTAKEVCVDGQLEDVFDGLVSWNAGSLGSWLGRHRDNEASGFRLEKVVRRSAPDAWRVTFARA
jgi:hypothetical protein